MTRIHRLAFAVAALGACTESDQAMARAEERAEELGKRAADKVQDVADKTRADAKMMARETAKEAKRMADHAGTEFGKAADQVSDVAMEGGATPAAPDEIRAVLGDVEAAIDCDGAGKCTVTKNFAERLKAHPDVVAAQAQCEAAQHGAKVGMRIRSLGDLPRKLGFEAGDVLTEINGVALTGAEAMPQLMLQLDATRFRIEFVRAGSEQSLQIDVV